MTSRITSLAAFLSAVVALFTGACAPDRAVLAVFDGGQVTLADLNEFLLTLPDKNREVPAGQTPTEWYEVQLRRVTFERLLLASESGQKNAASPELAAQRVWNLLSLLGGALREELAGEVATDEEQVARMADELGKRPSGEPVLNFRHIFFRLDHAATTAEVQAIRARAEQVRGRVLAGEEFAALAREQSDSTTASNGGLVQNVRPRDLKSETARALLALEEGQVSPVLQTATGLHILKLERRLNMEPPTRAQLEETARRNLRQQAVGEVGQQLLARLRQETTVEAGDDDWQVGSFTVPKEVVALLVKRVGSGDEAPRRQELLDRLLLADEARRRGLETAEVDRQVEQSRRVAVLTRTFLALRDAHCAQLPADELRATFEQRPSRFVVPAKTHLDLIFVPQGKEPFATQQRLEAVVRALRGGDSFAERARELSTGPGAEQGGDLGELEGREVGRLGQQVYDAVQRLEAGEVSDPVHCTDRVLTRDPLTLRGGFAIVRVRERLPERFQSFEEALAEVRQVHCREHRKEIDQAIMAALLEKHRFAVRRVPTPEELSQ